MQDNRTLEELAQEALNAQQGVNLSGIVHSFSRAVSRLRALYPLEGTRFFNTHPLCILWADKIKDLTGADAGDVCGAWSWAKEMTSSKEVKP